MNNMFRDTDVGRNLNGICFALNELVIMEKYKTLKEKRNELRDTINKETNEIEAARSHKMIFTDMEERAKYISDMTRFIKKNREELAFINNLIDVLEQYLFHGEIMAENDILEGDDPSQTEQAS